MSSNETTSWRSEPNGRGTFSLISSCILTLVFCVWSALHLNVPPAKATSSRSALEKTYWVLYGIFAPELVVATAASQYITARWLKREIEKDVAHREAEGDSIADEHTWTMTQCFNAVMGGLTVNTTQGRLTLSAEGTRLLSFIGALPEVSLPQIKDKSKADGLAKSVVCIQALWMVAQVIGRLVISLPVSLLEINTCGHVVCALVLYLLWWSKPFDILDPLVLPEYPGLENMLPFMLACSTVGVDAATKISKVRCLRYIGAGETDRRQELTGPSLLIRSQLSIGSNGLGDMKGFLGRQPIVKKAENDCFFQVGSNEISPFCSPYFGEDYKNLRLRHGEVYCRQFNTPKIQPDTTLSPEQVSQILQGADMVWGECATRPFYKRYFFTDSPTIYSSYLGEIDYFVKHIPNFPSLTNLSLGHVNISSNTLRYVFVVTAMAYGGLHLSGLNHHFASEVERILWIGSCVAIAGSGVILWVYFAIQDFSRGAPAIQREPHPFMRQVSYGMIVFLVVARIFLVVEAFISLRNAPVSLYETPEWSDLFPHL
ncbi:hypothetical protein HJFPF1_02099 [Paramyrothecium foliicola]|nr:hypothetical protein HJFPF1_02099 [Paramyrothecium foliicola]